MLAFGIAALLLQYVTLAIIELAVTAALFIFYRVQKARRQKDIQAFIQSTADSLQAASRGESPFAMVLLRLADATVIWTTDRFADISGFKERMYEQKITELLPGFTIDWLAAGKHEYSYDITFGTRRYRVYGSTYRADDPNKTMLGVLYFSDLTELYQVRDEYVRSRPVVAIILVDNYEELTMNL